MFDAIVIGSGPSSIASLLRLKPNLRVAVIEPSSTIPNRVLNQQRKFIEIFQRTRDGKHAARELIKLHPSLVKSSLSMKHYWNSTFVYRHLGNDGPNISNSRGGFSLVWGATAFPYSKMDLAKMSENHSFDIRDQTKHLEKLLSVAHGNMPSSMFENVATTNTRPHAVVFESLATTNGVSETFSFEFEPTRLALAPRGPFGHPFKEFGCIKCGLCQIGCPTGVVWNSKFLFEKLLLERPITLVQGWVDEIKETQESVTVKISDVQGESEITSRRLLLTGGVASTIQLLVNGGVYRELKLLDSQTTLTLMWSKKKIRVSQDNLSLADTSLTVSNYQYHTHTQLYSLNDYFISRLKNSYPILRFLPGRIFEYLAKRLIFGFTYFPQEMSGQLKYCQGTWKEFRSPQWKTIRSALRNLKVAASKSGLVLIPFRYHLSVGGGHHVGGNMFVRETWKKLDKNIWDIALDELARPNGSKRIHIMDATALGPIPTGSITLASMSHTSVICSRLNSLFE